MAYELRLHRQFIKDAKRLKQAGWPMKKLQIFLVELQKGPPFNARYKVHELQGDLVGIWDAHVSHNWIVLFRYKGERTIELLRTGTHGSLELS